MRKVCLIGPAHPLRGGIANFFECLAVALKKQGHAVMMVSYSLQYPRFLFPGKTQYVSEPTPAALRGIGIHTSINSVNPWTWIRSAWQVKKIQPDFVLIAHFHPFFLPSSLVLAIVLRIVHIPTFAFLHNVQPNAHGIRMNWLLYLFLRTCRGSIVTSSSARKQIQKLCKNRPILTVFHPPYSEKFGTKIDRIIARQQLHMDTEGKYLLFFGLIRPYKGLDILLRALADPRLRAMDVRLIIAGECYMDEQYFHATVRELQLLDRVQFFTHFIERQEASLYFSAADLLIQPYRFLSSQSAVTALAYHFNMPVIVTNVGGLPEQVPHGKTGFVVEPNATSIANSIVDFYTNGAPKTFQKNIEQYKKEHSWSVLAERIDVFCSGE